MNSDTSVPGERTIARVIGARSLAVRMQRTLAAVLVCAVGAAVLLWYYLHLGDDTGATAARGAAGMRSAAASEMRLPALAARPATRPPVAAPPSAEGETRTVGDVAAAQGRAAPHADAAPPADRPRPAAAADSAQPRQVAPVLVRPPAARANSEALTAALRESSLAMEAAQSGVHSSTAGTLGDALQPTVAKATEAALVASRRWLLPKGSFLDCTLETAIDSTFAGLTTCVLATDVYGADGRVVLMERGTKLVGESRSDVRAGQSRVAVLWDEARTPSGVVFSLASPGTDALGRTGVPGTVDRHTADRFGAAVLLSLLDAGVADLAARRQGSGAIVYNARDSSDIAAEVLRNTMAIPPTVRVAPGARVTVAVVRDVDFRAVYRLEPHEER